MAIAYPQGQILYVADDYVDDGYINEAIGVVISAPQASAFEVIEANVNVSSNTINVTAPEVTITVSQIIVEVDFPQITVNPPVATTGTVNNVIAYPKGIVLYVADDFIEDGYVTEPIDLAITPPQATAVAVVDAAAQASMVTVSLTAAEASATGAATATFGALLVSATAPQGSVVADGSVTVSVANGSITVSAPDPSVSANSFVTANSNTISITSPDATATGGGTGSATIPEIFVIKPSVYEYATEFPNAIPSVVISAPVATLSAGSSASVSFGTITCGAPEVSVSVSNSVDVSLNPINISAPVISVIGGTGATAATQGAIEYVVDDYVEDGYVLEFQLVEVTPPQAEARIVENASASADVGTVNIESPAVSVTAGVTHGEDYQSITVISPEATLSTQVNVSVSAPQVTITAPSVFETVEEFPEALPQITVSSPQPTATGKANVDVIFPEVQVTLAASTATGTANVSVSAATIQAQPPQVFETVREFPRTLPAIQVIAPVVVGTGTANVSVDHASVTVISPTSLGDTGGDAVSSPNFLIAVSSPQATATNNSTIAVNNASVTISSSVVEAVGLTLTNALAEVSIGTVTVSAALSNVSVFVRSDERTIIVPLENRVFKVIYENRSYKVRK